MSAGDNSNAGVSRFALRCCRREEPKTAAPQCRNTHGTPALVGPPVSGPQMDRNNGWTEDPTVTDQSNRGEQDGR